MSEFRFTLRTSKTFDVPGLFADLLTWQSLLAIFEQSLLQKKVIIWHALLGCRESWVG
jgi:hypothetical protein